jgi:hypothetical protein
VTSDNRKKLQPFIKYIFNMVGRKGHIKSRNADDDTLYIPPVSLKKLNSDSSENVLSVRRSTRKKSEYNKSIFFNTRISHCSLKLLERCEINVCRPITVFLAI